MGSRRLTRREFFRLFGSAGLASAGFPKSWFYLKSTANYPSISTDLLPSEVKEIIEKIPDAKINPEGFLRIADFRGKNVEQAPLLPTAWNIQHRRLRDKLLPHFPWGIVLHWYGDAGGFDKTAQGYLRGFDSTRRIDDYETQTSAHFLVGDLFPKGEQENTLGIIQTQTPDVDGEPFLASHLQLLNYQVHQEHKQYFVNALYQLSYSEPTVYHLLQDLYDGPKIDPNMRTLAVEVTGINFHKPGNYPSPQKVANILAVLKALMIRYRIPAENILGHNEIQLGKPDPGKQFMAHIRYLVGVYALVQEDRGFKDLVFGQFRLPDEGNEKAVARYFKFVRDYLAIVGTPKQVYAWEINTGYWRMMEENLQASLGGLPVMRECISPFQHPYEQKGKLFLTPKDHEGVDLYPILESNNYRVDYTPVKLVSDGVCVFYGPSVGCCQGFTAMFRHRLESGADVVTVYGNLAEGNRLQVGKKYNLATRIGFLENGGVSEKHFLHFAIAYGATWENLPGNYLGVPPGKGEEWILDHYMPPDRLTSRWILPPFPTDTPQYT